MKKSYDLGFLFKIFIIHIKKWNKFIFLGKVLSLELRFKSRSFWHKKKKSLYGFWEWDCFGNDLGFQESQMLSESLSTLFVDSWGRRIHRQIWKTQVKNTLRLVIIWHKNYYGKFRITIWNAMLRTYPTSRHEPCVSIFNDMHGMHLGFYSNVAPLHGRMFQRESNSCKQLWLSMHTNYIYY